MGKLLWTESKLRQTSNVFFSMGLKPSVFTVVWSSVSGRNTLFILIYCVDVCGNTLMEQRHPGPAKASEETETYFLSKLQRELISKVLTKKPQHTHTYTKNITTKPHKTTILTNKQNQNQTQHHQMTKQTNKQTKKFHRSNQEPPYLEGTKDTG